MPDADTLLPSNSTKLERALSGSTDWLERLHNAGPLLRTSKRLNIPDSVVPWLIYEYGLGELLPYLTDPRTAISTGVLWQRLRGTPESFRIALSWIGNDGEIEESEAGSIQWAQYQLGLAQAPNGLDQTDSVVELSRLSSPVRSSLFRIYGGWYDGRRFKLDEHKLSSFDPLSDHTGVYLKPEWPQLSFGRLTETLWNFTGEDARISVHRFIPAELQYEDRFILDQSRLDEFWHLLEQMQMSHTRITFILEQPKPARPSTTWTDSPDQTWNTALTWSTDFSGNRLKFCRAGIYLGDGALLGETNACLPAFSLEEVGDGPLLLSEFDPTNPGTQSLSGHVRDFVRQEILERFDRSTEFGAAANFVQETGSFANRRQHFIEDQAITVGIGASNHRTHVEEFEQPNDRTSTWGNPHTWKTANGWQPLFQELAKLRRHATEIAGGVSAIESKLDRTFSGSHAAPAAAFVLDEPIFATGEHVLDEDPSRDTVEIAESYLRRHTDLMAAPGVNLATTWAAASWQSAGDWAGTFADNHILSQYSRIDSEADAAVIALNPTGSAALSRTRSETVAATGALGTFSLHRTHTDTANITTAGEGWATLGTWADTTTWAGDAAQVTSASRTHHVAELTHNGIAIESNIAEIALDTETGPAPVVAVQVEFEHPNYFAQPQAWGERHTGLSLHVRNPVDKLGKYVRLQTNDFAERIRAGDRVISAIDTSSGEVVFSESDNVTVQNTYLGVQASNPAFNVSTPFVGRPYGGLRWTLELGTVSWADAGAWTSVIDGHGRNHADETPWALAAESTNYASQSVAVSEATHSGTTAELAISRSRNLRAFVPFFRGDEGWRTDAVWAQVFAWTETAQPETSHTRLRFQETAATMPQEIVTTAFARSHGLAQYVDDRFVLDEYSQLDEAWHKAADELFRTTVRTSVAFYPQNASGWSTALPWAGVWAWSDDFGLPISHHSQD